MISTRLEGVLCPWPLLHKTSAICDLRLQDNPGYNELFNYYLDNKYQLRYTGGMVPDVNQVNIIALVAGILRKQWMKQSSVR